jgi:hypothetical protein
LKSSARHQLAWAVMLVPMVGSLTACISLDNETGVIPEALRTASANISGNSYPNLAALPQVPKNLPAAGQWTAMEAELLAAASDLARAPNAALPKPGETDTSWSVAERRALDADPRAQPLARDAQLTGPEYEAWAAAERARLEAEIAALPPL